MKKLLFIALMFVGISASAKDVVVLQNGSTIEGQITKIANNSIKMDVNGEMVKISNNDIAVVSVDEEMTYHEKFRLGRLDGKRFALRKGGNFAVGFFFGLIGSGIVYLTSDQMPSGMAINGSNKAIVDDVAYLEGYAKGARSKVGGQALIGTASAVGAAILLSVIAVSSY